MELCTKCKKTRTKTGICGTCRSNAKPKNRSPYKEVGVKQDQIIGREKKR